MPIIRLTDVRKRYGAYEALRGVTLELDGGCIGLLGPNGAGKSTLLKVLLGLHSFEGRAEVLDLDVAREQVRVRGEVGYMPEHDALPTGLSAVELCAYAGELSGLPTAAALERAHAMLAFVGLEDKRYQKIGAYSTGMKQRVKLAQALVHDPRLLFLDEPTNGLDPQARDEILDLIATLPARSGCSVILSTHILSDVERICQSALLLHEGRVVYSGTLTDFRRAETANLYEVRVKARSQPDEGEDRMIASLRAHGCSVERAGALLSIEVPASEDASRLVFSSALSAGVQVRHFAPRQLTLEGAFIRAVEEAEARA